jgi:coenzyme F420-reducing hydrogenase delta subunit
LFRSLLDFLGIDIRRICFSWVSAAEGAKWAQVVNKTVADLRELGPYSEYHRVADFLSENKSEEMKGGGMA